MFFNFKREALRSGHLLYHVAPQLHAGAVAFFDLAHQILRSRDLLSELAPHIRVGRIALRKCSLIVQDLTNEVVAAPNLFPDLTTKIFGLSFLLRQPGPDPPELGEHPRE